MMCADLLRAISSASEKGVKSCPAIAIILLAKYARVNAEQYNKIKTPTSFAVAGI
jgi:hypothetical protein